MEKRGRRGQITLFIIGGLVILILVGLMLYLLLAKTEIGGDEDIRERESITYHQQETELRKFVQSCIEPISITAIEIMRLQGGYIELPVGVQTLDVVDREYHHLVDHSTGKPTIVTDPTGMMPNKVPYWFTPGHRMIIPDTEQHVARYIDEQVYDCVGDLQPFKDQGFTVTKGPITTNVTFGDQIIIDVHFPIRMQRGETDYTLSDFIYMVPINFGLIREMMITAVANHFLERTLDEKAREVLNRYGSVDPGLIPPISRTILSSSCNEVTWTKADVKEKVQDLLVSNWFHLHVNNTRFHRTIRSDPEEQGFFDSFILNFWPTNAPLVSMSYRYYEEWGLDFDIFPSQGDRIRPDYVKMTNPFTGAFCHLDYDFYYDLKFPTLIKIKDLESARINPSAKTYYPYEGFEFAAPVDVTLCGNQPRTCQTVSWTYDLLPQDVRDDTINETYFCEDFSRNSNPITFQVTDLYSGDPVDEVVIDYNCGNPLETCYIATTDAAGTATEQLPQCVNGNLLLSKPGYKRDRLTLTVLQEDARTIPIAYERFREMNVSLFLVDGKRYAEQVFVSTKAGSPNYSPAGMRGAFGRETAMVRLQNPLGYNSLIQFPERNAINISSGDYEAMIAILGNITAVDATVTLRGSSTPLPLSLAEGAGTYQGIYRIHMEPEYPLTLPVLEGKRMITFTFLVNFFAVDSLTAADVLDPVITEDGNISAEILESYEILGYDPDPPNYALCNTTNLLSRKISGLRFPEYVEDWNYRCTRAYELHVPRAAFEGHFKPEIT